MKKARAKTKKTRKRRQSLPEEVTPPTVIVTDGRDVAVELFYIEDRHDAPRVSAKTRSVFETHLLLAQARRPETECAHPPHAPHDPGGALSYPFPLVLPTVRRARLARTLAEAVPSRWKIPPGLYTPVAAAYAIASERVGRLCHRARRAALRHAKVGRPRLALRILRTALRHAMHSPHLRYEIATCHARLGDVKTAERWLWRAAAFPHDDAKLHLDIADAYAAVDRSRGERRALERAVRAAPKRAAIRLRLAATLCAARKWAAAARHAAEAIRLRPRNANGWHFLGIALGGQGKHRKGASALRRAVELCPAESGDWYNLGIACLNSGQEARAAEAFLEAARRSPTFPETQAYAAYACARAGRMDEARAMSGRMRAAEPPPEPETDRILRSAERLIRRAGVERMGDRA